MFSKEVSLDNYVIQTLPRILTVCNVFNSAFFQEINRSKLCSGNDDSGSIT